MASDLTIGTGAGGFTYRALHIKHVVIYPTQKGHRAEALEQMIDYEMLDLLLPRLPHLEKVVFAFEHDYSDDLRRTLLDHWPSLHRTDKLIVARADVATSNSACKWMEEDYRSLKSTGAHGFLRHIRPYS